MASLSSPLAPPALPAAQAQPQAGLVNIERNLEAQKEQNVKQTQEISGLRTTVQALRTETATLNNGIGSVSNLIQQDAVVEKQQEQQEVLRESRLAETKVRMGKESQLEQSITNALVAPVQALQPKISNIFDRIKSALFTLFAGWLTNQGIEALKASAEGNKTELEKIRDRVLNAFGDVIKVFTAIRTGFGLIIGTITTLAGRIAGFVTKLALAPIKALTNVLRGASPLKNLFGDPKKSGGGGGRGPGLIGGLITGISGALNFLNGENADAALAGISLLPLPGKVGFAVKVLAGGIFAIDDVLEVFGKNFIGADPKKLAAKRKELEEAKRNQTNQKPSSSTSAAEVAPVANPQTPLMGDKKDDKSESDPKNMTPGPVPGSAKIEPTSDAGAAPAAAPAAASTTASTTASGPMTSMAPQASELSLNNPPGALVPGQRPDKALTSEQFKAATQAREEAKVQGLSGKESEIYVANAAMNAGTPSTASISSPDLKQTPNVGALPEPSPNVIMAGGQGGSQQSPTPQAPSAGSDTPIINSSNPDNFYVLYSQLNYNVVI
jgi:hypothetical protein